MTEPATPATHILQLGMGWLPEQTNNGLDRVFHALTQHLPAADVNVHGLVAGSPSVIESSAGRVEAVASGDTALPTRLWAFRRAISHHLRSETYDAVAAHFALYAAPALDVLGDHPFIVHFHGPWASESTAEGEASWKTRLKMAMERAVYRRGDRFIVLSHAFRDELVRQYGIPRGRIRIVPGGVDTVRFAPNRSRQAAREDLGWPTDRPTILSVRRLIRRVGLENLVAAMETIHQQVPDALLMIAGTGPLQETLEAQVRAANLEHSVQFLGYVPDTDLPLAYRAANVSIVPTRSLEGFGLIAVESLAAGTPVLVTPVGGLPEVVGDLSDDLILPDGAPATIAACLADALTGALALPSGENCQAYARDRFDWRVIADRVRDVYAEVT